MNTFTTTRRYVAIAATTCFALAACGSSDTPVAGTGDAADEMTTDEMSTDEIGTDEMATDGTGGMQMNMGNADATPAEDVASAALARGDFELLDTRPAGYDDVQGTTVIARSTKGTTVTTELTGLLPNVEFISHLHAQACDDDNAGSHYQFEVGGSTTPPNEIHLAFTSNADGRGFMTAENAQLAGAEAVAFVVHPADLIDNKIACADLVADDSEAVAAAIATGATETDSGSVE